MKKTYNHTSIYGKCARSVVPLSLCMGLAVSTSYQNAHASENATESEIMNSEELNADQRYQLKRDGEDFVRLDRQTGSISICNRKGNSFVCQMAVDDRDALVDELSNLQDRVEELEERLGTSDDDEALLAERDDYGDGEADHDFGSEKFDDELDRVLDYSSRALKKFFNVMKDLKRDIEQDS